MPVEIKELVIRATIQDQAGASENLSGKDLVMPESDYQAIVEECVQRVMEKIRERDER